jgi:hypothetical protein
MAVPHELLLKVQQLEASAKRKQKKPQQPSANIEAEPSKEKKSVKAKVPSTGKIIRLPIWPEEVRGTPNSLLRSALFAAIQGKTRKTYAKQTVLASIGGIIISYQGTQLDQADLDVWEQCIHLARAHPVGSQCYFTATSFLKAIGRSTGKSNHVWLKSSFIRLNACSVEIKLGSREFFGSLITWGARDENTGQYVIELNPHLVNLFEYGWTPINLEHRKNLNRKPLALWLHGFYASHTEPFPMKIETLRNLSGSENKELKDFKRKLINALLDLKSVGAIADYEIKNGLVCVHKFLPSQEN